MPKARKYQISLDVTPYYHCVSRCVRRAFLCGFDKLTEVSFEHRRQWIEDRILLLGQIFAIDVCAYAVMSNHYHVVLHINKSKCAAWSDLEVCTRWHRLFKGTPLTQKYLRGEFLTDAERLVVKAKLDQWRLNLCDISWFMRLINEPLARQANHEDECTGKFWEARFRSQALCDEKALAACLAYVDLNPVRAHEAETPERSEHTSIKKRIACLKSGAGQPGSLAAFVRCSNETNAAGLPFNLVDYLELVDWTGRIIRDEKSGFIDSNTPPILQRLEIEPKQWLYLTTKFESRLKTFVGGVFALKRAGRKLGYLRTPGLAACRAAFR